MRTETIDWRCDECRTTVRSDQPPAYWVVVRPIGVINFTSSSPWGNGRLEAHCCSMKCLAQWAGRWAWQSKED